MGWEVVLVGHHRGVVDTEWGVVDTEWRLVGRFDHQAINAKFLFEMNSCVHIRGLDCEWPSLYT